MRLYLHPERTKVSLVDISQGGIRFTHSRNWNFSLGTSMEFLLVSGKQELLLEGNVVRTGEARDLYGYATGFTAVKFSYLAPDTRQQLGGLLHDLSRHKLAKRSGVLIRDQKKRGRPDKTEPRSFFAGSLPIPLLLIKCRPLPRYAPKDAGPWQSRSLGENGPAWRSRGLPKKISHL